MSRKAREFAVIPKTAKNSLMIKPQTEKYLFVLQLLLTSFSDNREAWQEIFATINSYSTSLLLKLNTGKLYLPPAQISDKAIKVSTEFLGNYKLQREINSNYKIEASFAGVLKWKCYEAMYASKEADMEISLSSMKTDDDKELEEKSVTLNLKDFLYSSDKNISTFLEEDSLLNIIKELKKVLKEVDEVVSTKVSLMIKLYLLLPKNKKRVDSFFKKQFIKDNREWLVLEYVKMEIKKRINDLMETSSYI